MSNPFGDAERHKPPADQSTSARPTPAVSSPFGDAERHQPPAESRPVASKAIDSFFSNPQRHFKPNEPKAQAP
eukprot:5725893-Pyramimonas_sp.AAC.1